MPISSEAMESVGTYLDEVRTSRYGGVHGQARFQKVYWNGMIFFPVTMILRRMVHSQRLKAGSRDQQGWASAGNGAMASRRICQ